MHVLWKFESYNDITRMYLTPTKEKLYRQLWIFEAYATCIWKSVPVPVDPKEITNFSNYMVMSSRYICKIFRYIQGLKSMNPITRPHRQAEEDRMKIVSLKSNT